MELIADRFVRANDRRVIDLATGREILLIAASAGGAAEQTRWTVRCDTIAGVRHRAMARLVDYGRLGETRRFEAWDAGAEWEDRFGAAETARDRARAFLRANSLTSSDEDRVFAVPPCAHPAVVPGSAAGYAEAVAARPAIDLQACGMALCSRPQLAAIAELFADSSHAAPRCAAVWGPIGSGVETAIGLLARAARLSGLIPVDVGAAIEFREVLRDRTLCLIDRSGTAGRGDAPRWPHLVQAVLRSARPHILLLAERQEVRRAAAVRLGPVSTDSLIESIRPRDLPVAVARQVQDAAGRSNGLPGRFAGLLWGTLTAPKPLAMSLANRVAEGPAPYDASPAPQGPEGERGLIVRRRDWPVPVELAGLRSRLDQAVALIGAGSQASGVRTLRQVTGALVRRRDWAGAGRGSLALAAALLKRGKPRDAQAVLAECGEHARMAGDERLLIDVAVLCGRALTDLARLEEAEATLRAAFAATSGGCGGEARAMVTVALARCLFWRGRYDEAAALVDGYPCNRTGGIDPALAALGACVAVGRGDIAGAVSRARDALKLALAGGDPAVTALANCSAALAHLAVGDPACVDRHVRAGIGAARAARDPLRAIKARLLGAENARRTGCGRAAARVLARLHRLSASDLPPIVNARCALMRDLISAPSPTPVVARHVAASGLPALELFAPLPQPGARAIEVAPDDLIEVLRCCQMADHDGAALRQACATLRPRLNAAALAVFVRDGAAVVPIAGDGGRADPEMANRIIDAGQAVPPHVNGDRLAGGAVIRYGGRTIGAIVARWTLGTPVEGSRCSGLLAVCATAVAPAVAAAIARRMEPADLRDSLARELLGASAAMETVRAAVERAAAAPFAVLVEGESGSGKELVARGIHRRSPRRDRPFCTLNCAALPDDLVESELFGHARGAFSGAVAERPGVFEEAHTGTLFLDEIGELSLRAQAKVLRTIQEGELRRVGENVSRRVDVRIVAATNRTLADEVTAGRFRLDLYYRLDVIRIAVPPLRDRPEDIAILVEHFWRDAVRRIGSHAVLSTATVAALARYQWPGNVRELQNVLAALAVRSPRRGVVPPTALPPVFGHASAAEAARLDEARRTFEERFVRAALVRTGGHRGRAAEELGVSRQGLTKLMVRLGIGD